ncbi:hypothetical protein, partial [Chryseobacterium sp.]|uniref:hypothetical protein n=1 Tax=Chryseobacterium sp. TaxID=1871047 RepID=UPI0025C0592B
ITSNSPPLIGEKIKITDNADNERANSLQVDWIMLILGCVFTGISIFIAVLISTYITHYTMKKRVLLSLGLGLIISLINGMCIVVLVKI